MPKNDEDKLENEGNLTLKTEDDLFLEKVKAAYSQMGKLGGLARAKQMAEQGFKAKPIVSSPNESKNDPKKAYKKTTNS